MKVLNNFMNILLCVMQLIPGYLSFSSHYYMINECIFTSGMNPVKVYTVKSKYNYCIICLCLDLVATCGGCH